MSSIATEPFQKIDESFRPMGSHFEAFSDAATQNSDAIRFSEETNKSCHRTIAADLQPLSENGQESRMIHF
jgi:hypothetical protein